MADDIRDHCSTLSGVLTHLPFDILEQVEESIMGCYRGGGTVFLVGNGGSAATASHFACDLSKGTRHVELPRFRVVALTDNVPLMTAWANDSSYDRIFAEQLCALLRAGDLLLAISASGNSANIVEAVCAAHDRGATTVVLTGPTGGRVSGFADIAVHVPAPTIEQVEDAHSVITHGLTVALRRRLQEEAQQAGSRTSSGGERPEQMTPSAD